MTAAFRPEPPDERMEQNISETGKRARMRLAKSELWMFASIWAADHADDIGGRPRPGEAHAPLPMEQWGANDPFVDLCARYGISSADLERLLKKISDECETRATRVGFDEAWR